MTADATPRRHPLLPVLAGSRAVLVGRDTPDPDADHGFGHGYESAVEATRALARTLVSPNIGTPFLEAHTEQLVRGESPDAVIDAVRRAAAAASDTLLFSYAATGPEHWETPRARSSRPRIRAAGGPCSGGSPTCCGTVRPPDSSSCWTAVPRRSPRGTSPGRTRRPVTGTAHSCRCWALAG
ncbi:hypothetical protein [Micromonospora sp. NPDC023814]|uniref:hypothetical protein n=1 Tax=Micromonospora sp. NPDC023814 TaxID=3154596 RepID=UPI0033E2504F